jgi:hypothetical protein
MKIRGLMSSSAMTIFINLSTGILGPHILLARVFGRNYIKFLRTHLGGLLEHASFSMRLDVWFQHNCAPPHYIREVRHRFFEKVLDSGLVLDAMVQFSGLDVHLT